MAKLYFKYGAMNSGKSTVLLQTAHNYEERGMKVILLKPSKDLKADDNVISRLGIKRKVDYLIDSDTNIYELAKSLDVNCILVDEAQFLEIAQVDQLLMVSHLLDIPVICYGLRTDFRTNGFDGSTRLLLIADKLEELKTVCKCGVKATFNARFVNNEFAVDGEQVVIDNDARVNYVSMCPKCYIKQKKLIKK